jgi:DNA anti-recombination protein RmuC
MEEEKVLNILQNYKSRPNKDLMFVLDFLKSDFEKTKDLLIKLTHHLDMTEQSYNKVFDEFNKRNNNNG